MTSEDMFCFGCEVPISQCTCHLAGLGEDDEAREPDHRATIARLTAELEAARALAEEWRVECLAQNSALIDANHRAEALLPRAYQAGREDAAVEADKARARRNEHFKQYPRDRDQNIRWMAGALQAAYLRDAIRALPIPSPADLAARLEQPLTVAANTSPCSGSPSGS